MMKVKVLAVTCFMAIMIVSSAISGEQKQTSPRRDPAADWKHPSDPCPKGKHEVTKESNANKSGQGKVEAGNVIIKGSASGTIQKGTVEKQKVCRDNKDDDTKERGTSTKKKK